MTADMLMETHKRQYHASHRACERRQNMSVYYKIIGRPTCLRNLKVGLAGYLGKDSESGKCMRCEGMEMVVQER